MKLRCAARVAAAVLVLALAAPVHGQSFGFPWWRDARFQKDLNLTAEQSTRIDSVFQSTITLLRQKRVELDQQEAELSRLIAGNADELVVTRHVDKVEGIRAKLNKTRTLMLLRMRQVLSPEQRVQLNKMHEEQEKNRRRPRNEAKK